MKPEKASSDKQTTSKHPQPLGGEHQALAEKASNSSASVKARIDSKNMPDKPALHQQHMPNSSGRK
ncbi:MAG TPA: hypothetical protein VE934_12910 [Polaromonas sp.]|uniref:hypothetical protein n=1 Tax=Polaromonas sp. TaxID=1869339 RepID=UPI002D4F708F|nr:hypothetical protein [Polaromonas sp.]HYW57857.1 hypothetical protein [Polaromonas sp.]